MRGLFLAYLKRKFGNSEFCLESFPKFNYDPEVLEDLLLELKREGKVQGKDRLQLVKPSSEVMMTQAALVIGVGLLLGLVVLFVHSFSGGKKPGAVQPPPPPKPAQQQATTSASKVNGTLAEMDKAFSGKDLDGYLKIFPSRCEFTLDGQRVTYKYYVDAITDILKGEGVTRVEQATEVQDTNTRPDGRVEVTGVTYRTIISKERELRLKISFRSIWRQVVGGWSPDVYEAKTEVLN